MPSQNSKRKLQPALIPTEKSYLLGKDTSNKQRFNTWSRLYDIINMIITAMDLLTDIMVVIHFYNSPKGVTFFWFSLTFVLLTHICYVVLALITFGTNLTKTEQILWFLCLIPLSPILPYLIYCASWPHHWITLNVIDRFGLERVDWNTDGSSFRSTPWKKFVSEKCVTNIAFIAQAFFESFPQSIIQIIAIVSFQEYRNQILITSISFSLLSIIFKSILMASGASTTAGVYKWLCFVTDFYATLFVMVSWAFLTINNHHNENCDFLGLLNISPSISWLGYVYIYKIMFLVLPMVVLTVLVLIFELSIDSIHDFLCWKSRNFIVLLLCYVPFVIIVVITVLILALICALIAAEFACFIWAAMFVQMFFNERYKWLDKPVFWDIIVGNFLLVNTKDTKDLTLRLCIVNYILSQTTESEWVKRMFVDFNSWININEYRIFHDPKYQITKRHLRGQFRDSNCNSAATMFGTISRMYMFNVRNLNCDFESFFRNIAYFLILFIGIPLYVLSRIMTLIYPFWCIFYMVFEGNGKQFPLYQHSHFTLNEIKLHFDDIPIFCVVTTIIYFILMCILLLIGRKLYELMNILWHIMPGRQKLVKSLIVDKTNMDYLGQLNAMYYFHIHRPKICDLLNKKFSNDVGKIITLYLPRTYVEECRLYKDGNSRYSRRRNKTLTMTPSSSPHLAIDCVEPLPPMSRYCSGISSTTTTDIENDDEKYGINLTAPQLAIPIDCDDPLSLLLQHNKKESLL